MLIIKWLTQKNNVQKLLYSQYNQVLEGWLYLSALVSLYFKLSCVSFTLCCSI